MSLRTPLRLTGSVERLKGHVRDTVRRFGVDVVPYPRHHPAHRRVKLLRHYGIDLVLDVGANVGQYADELRRHGYADAIVSFEPLVSAFAVLSARARTDQHWTVVHAALGDECGTHQMNIASDTQSSSLLTMMPAHTDADPTSGYVGTETVSTLTLDSLFAGICSPSSRPFLKVDTQGFERQVLAGAGASLPRILGVQLELSLVELYSGSMLFREATETMLGAGFTLMGIEPGFSNPETGLLLQCDGIFFRATP